MRLLSHPRSVQSVVLSPAIVVRNWEAEFKKFVKGPLAHVLNVIVLDAGTVSGIYMLLVRVCVSACGASVCTWRLCSA